MNKTTINKFCVFPDETKVQLHSILDVSDTHTQVCYYWENLAQILWVPNDFVI
jgi:hypothetical protein